MAVADDIYRRLCLEAQADRLTFLREWRDRAPRVRARDRMLLSHLRTSLAREAEDDRDDSRLLPPCRRAV